MGCNLRILFHVQAATSLLSWLGLESKDHATTVAILEYFFSERISMEMIRKFNELGGRKNKIEAITIDEKYIDYLWNVKRARETVQYGISIKYNETGMVMRNARDFVTKIKLVINELDGKMIEIIENSIKELQHAAE